MPVPSITQTKAEVQKLIKLYNKLQTEAKTADTEEATSKANQAEQLMQQINTLQTALSKAVVKKSATKPSDEKNTNNETKRTLSVAEKRIELEKRINRIESAQEQTRLKIKQLNLAKADLSRLQVEAKKNAESMAKRINQEYAPQAQDLADLRKDLHNGSIQYQKIKKELDIVREQAQKDTELLREQRDVALEKQKKLEKENIKRLRFSGNEFCLKGILAGVGLGILGIVVFAIVVFKTTLLDDTICQVKNFDDCSSNQEASISKKKAKE